MPLKGPTYHKGEKVTYTSFGKSCEALVVGAHLDDELEPYYTIQLPDGREKQTDDAHLSPLVLQPPLAAHQPAPTVSSSSSLQPQAPMPKQPPPSPPPPPLSSAQPNMVFKNQSAPTIRKEQQLPKPQDRPWEEVNDTKVLPKPKPEQPTTFRSTQRRHDTMKQHPSSSSSAARGGELPSDGREKEHSHNHQQYQPSSSSRKKQQQRHYHKMGNNHTTTTQQKQKQQSSHSRSRRRSSQKQQRQQPHQSAASASHHPYDHPSYNSHRRYPQHDDPWQMHPFGRSHRSSMFGSGGGFEGSGMMPTTIRSRL